MYQEIPRVKKKKNFFDCECKSPSRSAAIFEGQFYVLVNPKSKKLLCVERDFLILL